MTLHVTGNLSNGRCTVTKASEQIPEPVAVVAEARGLVRREPKGPAAPPKAPAAPPPKAPTATPKGPAVKASKGEGPKSNSEGHAPVKKVGAKKAAETAATAAAAAAAAAATAVNEDDGEDEDGGSDEEEEEDGDDSTQKKMTKKQKKKLQKRAAADRKRKLNETPDDAGGAITVRKPKSRRLSGGVHVEVSVLRGSACLSLGGAASERVSAAVVTRLCALISVQR